MMRLLPRARRAKKVDPRDDRSPMLRLLLDGYDGERVYPNYHQQWRTMLKAQRLGYLDDDQRLTDAGRAFIAHESR